MNRSFLWGVGAGLGGLWLFHRYVKPVPTTKA